MTMPSCGREFQVVLHDWARDRPAALRDARHGSRRSRRNRPAIVLDSLPMGTSSHGPAHAATRPHPLRVDAAVAFRLLCGATALLSVANAIVVAGRLGGHEQLWGLSRLFDVNAEGNVPALFSTLQLVLLCACLALVGLHCRRQGDRADAVRWLVLAALALGLATDEAVGIHELVRDLMRERWSFRGVWYFAWVIPYLAVTLVTTLAFWRFVWSWPPALRRDLCLAGALFVGAAIGLEMLAGWLLTGGVPASRRDLAVAVSYSLEELGEMLAVALAIRALLQHAARLGIAVEFGRY